MLKMREEAETNPPNAHLKVAQKARREMDAKTMKASAPEGSVIKKMSEEEITRLLAKAAKEDKRVARQQDYNTRKRIADTLLRAKALKAGLSVTNAEVDAEIKRRGL